jgi:hypothetical protein
LRADYRSPQGTGHEVDLPSGSAGAAGTTIKGDVMSDDDPDALATLTVVPTEFEANALVVVLKEAGIEAFAFGIPQAGLGAPFTAGQGVPVQVRRADLEQARAALDRNVADSIDIDWDEVDVGSREDALPLHSPRRMPVGAKIAMVLAIVIVLINLIAVGMALID